YTYAGRERDAETELLYERARFYDAASGRWITEDPKGFDAGDSNLYRYVNNKPLILTDPTGLQAQGELSPEEKRFFESLNREMEMSRRGALAGVDNQLRMARRKNPNLTRDDMVADIEAKLAFSFAKRITDFYKTRSWLQRDEIKELLENWDGTVGGWER